MLLRNTLFALAMLAQTGIYASYQPAQPDQGVVAKMFLALHFMLPKSYVTVDLGLKEEELALFEKLDIQYQKDYSRFGNLEQMNEELPEYLRKLGNNDEELIQAVVAVLDKIVTNVMSAFDKPSAWVTVRAFSPTTDYDMPRWHTDGYYYGPYYGAQFKFGAALKGNQTLFYPMTEELHQVYRQHWNDREFLSMYFDVKDAETAERGQGAFFVVGNANLSALHSEPRIDTQRLFISIVPGQVCEIEELYNRWHPVGKHR